MLGDYAKLMAKYSTMTKKISALDESTMTSADAAYYIEVTGRVTAKLATL